MLNSDFDANVTCIAPGRNPADRLIARRLRAIGLWDTLCRAAELGDRMVEALGLRCVAELLLRAGRKNVSMSAWGYWKRLLGMPTVPEDAEGFRFADGWVERLGVRDDDDETPPGCIPDTFEDEKVAWGCHPETGEVYPVPY